MTAEERMRERAARAITPVITQGNAAQQIYNSALVWAEQCIRALPLEGDQGEPAKDQRGAAAPDTADHGRVNSVEAMNAEAETTQSAPHHHSRTEQVDRNLTPENQARIEDTFQGLVSQHFDCHYNGEPSKCDKDCAQLGYCKRRTSEPAPAREPWCTYCGTDSHDDAKCWSTRPSPWGPQNAGYKQRPQAGQAREPSAVEEVKRSISDSYELRCNNALALRHAEELDRLREQLQGGVVVPREPTLDWLREFCRHPALDSLDGTEDIQDAVRIILNALAAAKEPK